MYKRIWIAALVISAVMLLYIGRLAWLQLMPGSSSAAVNARYAAQGGWQRLAVQQRQRSLVLDTGRGDFYDRNGLPITGETYMTAAFFPIRSDERGTAEDLSKLGALLNVSAENLMSVWDAVREPIFWTAEGAKEPVKLTAEQAEGIKRLGLNGVRVLPYRNRYVSGFEAKHAIGFTSQHPEWLQAHFADELMKGKRKLTEQVGGAGLEKSLDKLLRGVGATSVSYFIDGRSSPLHGLDLRLTQPGNSNYPLKAITTLDLRLQNKIEAYLDELGIVEGAVVVLDAHNADIVAMVSRPKLKPGQFRSGDGSEWENHAIRAVAPGSIFKLVTEAAALETRVSSTQEMFHCDGEYGKYGLSCWKEGGHGWLTLEEGLAQSCNIAFATVAERLKPSELKWAADALGIGRQAGWHREKAFGPFAQPLRLLGEEEAGSLFAPAPAAAAVKRSGKREAALREAGAARPAGVRETERSDASGPEAALAAVDGGVMAQSGIGQRDVTMSPLQAANLIVTLLNGGRVMEPRLVSEIRYAGGQRMVKLPAQRAQGTGGRIRPATARALLRGMEAVVDHGTGRSIRQGLWAVAGKSGTAEVSRAGAARNHQWFAGYGPAAKPRYAIAVLVENRPPGSSNQATKLFRGVMDIAARMER
ncbi:penicillin-binding protein 2 [Paenibacillus sp. N4]|uniref:peptidoglycan D,D-transpeptidase FtsI family protein n=1 Tax=Paenibacillus vietnamensis TaxID=2590547 RepID=UPI001CD10735|nr:penicillin-binding protein 2 [Paenibacillus vietnamensis]MCA0755213.1 penicillin-binding protein 2 [Paenibacillus vietnamensis]